MAAILRLRLDDPAWHDFVASRSEATPFHHPAWASLLAECYGFSAFALALADDDGTVLVGSPILEIVRFRRRSW